MIFRYSNKTIRLKDDGFAFGRVRWWFRELRELFFTKIKLDHTIYFKTIRMCLPEQRAMLFRKFFTTDFMVERFCSGSPLLDGHNVNPHFLDGHQESSIIGSQLVSVIMKGTGDSAIALVVGGCSFWQSHVPLLRGWKQRTYRESNRYVTRKIQAFISCQKICIWTSRVINDAQSHIRVSQFSPIRCDTHAMHPRRDAQELHKVTRVRDERVKITKAIPYYACPGDCCVLG